MVNKKNTSKSTTENINNSVEKKTIEESSKNTATIKKSTIQPKVKFSSDELIEVVNATQGSLILVDSDGYQNVLDSFGDSIELEYGELIKLKKRYPKIFAENWIQVPPTVLNSLGVEKYYEHFINVNDFDSIFNLNDNELRKTIENLSNSMKQSLGLRAIKLIEDGVLDSIKKIKVLEEILGYDLIEK